MNRQLLAVVVGAFAVPFVSLAGAAVDPIEQSFEFDLNRAATPTAPHEVAAGEGDPLHDAVRAALERMADGRPAEPQEPVYASFERDLNRAATPTTPREVAAGEGDPLHDAVRATLERIADDRPAEPQGPVYASFEHDLNRIATPTAPRHAASRDGDPLHAAFRAALGRLAEPQEPVDTHFAHDPSSAAPRG